MNPHFSRMRQGTQSGESKATKTRTPKTAAMRTKARIMAGKYST